MSELDKAGLNLILRNVRAEAQRVADNNWSVSSPSGVGKAGAIIRPGVRVLCTVYLNRRCDARVLWKLNSRRIAYADIAARVFKGEQV